MIPPSDEPSREIAAIARDEQTVRAGFWPKLASSLARIPFAEEAVAAYYCAFDPKTPLKVRGMLLAALVYFIVPLDLVPDLLIGIGFTDDLTVLLTAFGLIRSHLKPEHRERARRTVERLRRQGAEAPLQS